MKNKITINKFYFIVILFLFVFLNSSMAKAHPGRTDSYGCHTCRTNCAKWGLSTGEYHCHQAKSLPQPEEPIKSHYSESGGYTESAPEYKEPKIEKTTPVEVNKLDTPPVETNTNTDTAIPIPPPSQNLQVNNLDNSKEKEDDDSGYGFTIAGLGGVGYLLYRLIRPR